MEDFYPLEVKEECNTIEVDSNTLKTEEHEKPEIKEEIKEPFSEITGQGLWSLSFLYFNLPYYYS